MKPGKKKRERERMEKKMIGNKGGKNAEKNIRT